MLITNKEKMSQNKKRFITPSKLPFRPGVGMMIINQKKEIFVGKRIDNKYKGWQMPQGGIDKGETASVAALREMEEEVGSSNAKILAHTKNWYSYRVPVNAIPRLWGGKYCGQKQRWFLIEFQGEDDEINIHTENPEFREWRWINSNELLDHIVSFKYNLYRNILMEFEDYFK